MSKLLRMGLIGLGKAGLRHATAIAASGAGRVVAVADPADEARAVADGLGVRHHADHGRLLADETLDAVVISLPHSLLAAAALDAIDSGRHVLLEKPMGTTLEDAERVVRAAESAGVRLMVNYVHRFRSEYRQAKAALSAGIIGRPVMILDVMASGHSSLPGWVWHKETAGGGMLMYNGVHSLDRLIWLADSPVAAACGMAGSFSYDAAREAGIEDNMIGTFTFANGVLGAALQHKSAAARTEGGWHTTIFGTNGSIRVASGSHLRITSDQESYEAQTTGEDRFLAAFREFAAAVREERPPVPSGQDGVRALTAALALYRSASTATVVTTERGTS